MPSLRRENKIYRPSMEDMYSRLMLDEALADFEGTRPNQSMYRREAWKDAIDRILDKERDDEFRKELNDKEYAEYARFPEVKKQAKKEVPVGEVVKSPSNPNLADEQDARGRLKRHLMKKAAEKIRKDREKRKQEDDTDTAVTDTTEPEVETPVDDEMPIQGARQRPPIQGPQNIARAIEKPSVSEKADVPPKKKERGLWEGAMDKTLAGLKNFIDPFAPVDKDIAKNLDANLAAQEARKKREADLWARAADVKRGLTQISNPWRK